MFAEVLLGKDNDNDLGNTPNISETKELLNTEKIKLDLLNNEIEIFKESNSKFIEENQSLKKQLSSLNNEISKLEQKINSQQNIIDQNDIDKEELIFLRLNLIHSYKCKKTIFNDGYKVGTKEYKECILKKGKKLDD